jgi:hypothetical protein
MTNLHKRLAALEVQRPCVCRLEELTDGELIRIITGHTDTVISDEQLERIIKGETWDTLKNA